MGTRLIRWALAVIAVSVGFVAVLATPAVAAPAATGLTWSD